jgi:hypothetical protein
MSTIKAVSLAAILVIGLAAWAQEFPKAELGIDYSFTHYEPSARYSQSHNLNGGGGSIVFNLNRYFGIKADLQGYTSGTTTFRIPVGTKILPAGGIFSVQGNLFTYMFGPQIKVRTSRVAPFGELLFGGAHSNVYANLFRSAHLIGASPANNAFAMVFGGGFDVPISGLVSIRPVQVDYMLTRFGNIIVTNNQNNIRYQAGVVFNLGNK